MKNKVILKKKPKKYLKQGLSYCGGYVIKGILSAFGKDDGRRPEKYIPFHSFASSNFIIKSLKKYNLKVKIKCAKDINEKERLKILKENLKKESSIILRIGNGYMKNGKFNLIRAIIFGHWISVWGFDDNKKIFYIYDSAAPYIQWRKDIPIGNVARSYGEVLRDWRLGSRLGFGIGRYRCIAIHD